MLCTGDLLDGPTGNEVALIDELASQDVLCIAGNHERWHLEAARRAEREPRFSAKYEAYLARLPTHFRFALADGRFLLLHHAVPGDDMRMLLPRTPDEEVCALLREELRGLPSEAPAIFVLGHTHVPMVRELQIEGRAVAIVNAGALDSRGTPVCSVLDLQQNEVRFQNLHTARRRREKLHLVT